MKRALLTSLVLFACLAGWAASASAHAVLESSIPTRGAQFETAPKQVEFTFNEPVEASLGAVRVFNTSGEQVQTAGIDRPGESANSVGAGLPAGLPGGLYTATYHVVSADSHPISGGITFTVGNPGGGDGEAFAQGSTISELLAETESGPVTEVGFWFIRWIGYLAIALAIGALVWMLFVLPRTDLPERSLEGATRRFRGLVLLAGSAGLVASLLAIVFQGAVGAGNSFWEAFGSGIPGQVMETRFGTMMLVRAGAWAGLIALFLFAAGSFRRAGAVSIAGLALGALLVVTPALAGHASTRDPGWLLIPSDVIHVAAMAVWTGGLAAMLWILPPATRGVDDPAGRTAFLTSTTVRFSTVALVSVALIGVSGAIQSILEVGTVGDLFSTQFGRAVAIKIVLFAVLIGFGAANRMRVIPGLVNRLDKAQSPGKPGLRLRRLLRVEVMIVVAVLGVSAALVSYPPPDAIQAGPASGSTEVEGKLIEYTVEPARVGSNEVHLYVFDDKTGAPVPVRAMDVSFALPGREIAPIEARTRRVGRGHFVIPSAMLGVKGDWLAEVAIRLSRFEQPIAEFEVEIK